MLLETEVDARPGTLTLSDNSPWTPGSYPQFNDLRRSFPNLIPRKPYCADNLEDGLRIRSTTSALERRHIQLNGPASFQWMVHDIDRPDAYFAHDDAILPPPNVIMMNLANGHAHAAYLLASPVARHRAARLAPLRFYAAVERGVGRRLGADRHYGGLIAKNPMHRCWRTEWRRAQPYTLVELEGHLFERDMRPDPTIATTLGAGRNVTVFDELRQRAYREIRRFKNENEEFPAWVARCEELALATNLQFPGPLRPAEVRAIAKSVAKWTWKHFSLEAFQARQSRLGKRGMAKRWEGHVALSRSEPWKAMDIGRSTFYRRRKKSIDRSPPR